MNGKELKRIAIENGLTQNEFAKECGVSAGAMSLLIRGKRDARVEVLKRICERFNVKPEDVW